MTAQKEEHACLEGRHANRFQTSSEFAVQLQHLFKLSRRFEVIHFGLVIHIVAALFDLRFRNEKSMSGAFVFNDMVSPPLGFGFGFPNDIPWPKCGDAFGNGEMHEITFNPFTYTPF
jgi:hypothetical protein